MNLDERQIAFELDKYKIGLAIAASKQAKLEKALSTATDKHIQYELKNELRLVKADIDFINNVMKQLLKQVKTTF